MYASIFFLPKQTKVKLVKLSETFVRDVPLQFIFCFLEIFLKHITNLIKVIVLLEEIKVGL